MTYKKITGIIVLFLLVVFVYAQSNIDNFLGIKNVKVLVENSTIEDIQQEGNIMKVSISGKVIELIRSEEKYVTVTKEKCNKLGFVYLPGYGYEFINTTEEFTQNNGWVLGVAYSKNDNFQSSLVEMKEFIDTAQSYDLRPIVRVLGNSWQDEIMPSKDVIAFINALEKATTMEFHVQIWDKPNVDFGDRFTAKEYASYVKEIADETNVPIISGSLSLGEGNINYNRTSAEEYFLSLLEEEDFWESIDYWGSSLYNLDETGTECINVTEIDFYEGQVVCSNSIYNYRYELEMIKRETGKQFNVFLTETGYPNPENNIYGIETQLEQIKADPHVEAGTIFVANGWDAWQSSSWLNENRAFKSFVSEIESCG